MGDKENEKIKKYLEVLKALDEAIKEGPWDSGLFFKATEKKLKEMRRRFVQQFNLKNIAEAGETQAISGAETEQKAKLPAGYVEVYISIYLSDGANINKWQTLLSNISAHTVTRPVYRNEPDVRSLIRSKHNKLNEAYVIAHIKEADILPPPDDKPLRDRNERELLVLREGAVQVGNIIEFVHISGIYRFTKGQLVRHGSIDLLEHF